MTALTHFTKDTKIDEVRLNQRVYINCALGAISDGWGYVKCQRQGDLKPCAFWVPPKRCFTSAPKKGRTKGGPLGAVSKKLSSGGKNE